MSKFFIRRPIVAIVIAILMMLVGAVSMLQLPIAQYPNIVPPEIQVRANYTGADAQTIEQSVAAPIEQQMSGVDKSNYIQSVNANGSIRMTINFDVATDPNVDHILTQMRVNQASSQLPQDVVNAGVTVQKSTTAPLLLIALNSPKGTYNNVFLANYANINLIDQITRVPGISNVQVFGAGQYAMRLWVKPDQLAKLSVTVTDIINALRAQNTVNPAGQIGGEPAPPGQEFTYTVRSPGRLTSAEEFGEIVIRANPDGSLLRVKEVARIELGAQVYTSTGRLDEKPAAVLACYQLPGTNALEAANGVKALMERVSPHFPADMSYAVGLDTTRAVTAGMHEIIYTLIQALALVILVVFIFLQGWRATLIPLCAVPVSLIGTFMLFPLFGFTINTLALFNRGFRRTTDRYVSASRIAIRKGAISLVLLVGFALLAGLFGSRLSSGFLPEEDQGYLYGSLALPYAASMERTGEAAHKVEQALLSTPGVDHVTSVIGFNLLSTVQTTFNAFFFITLKPWHDRTAPNEQYAALKQSINQKLAAIPEGIGFSFPPPAIPGIGTSGGVTFMLEDRAGRDPAFLAENLNRFLEAVRKRPEIAAPTSTFLPSVAQGFIHC